MAKQENPTTVFKADITDFKASMQEAARLVRLANSEFKAATAGMDDWSKSTDGLSAKASQLTKVLEAQKRQLDALNAEYKKAVAEQGEDSRAAQELQIRINNQKAAIANTESQLDSYEKQLDDVENATIDAGEASEKAANGGFTVLKGVIANLATEVIKGAISGLKNLTKEVVKTGTEFEASMSKVAALSGASAEELELLTDTARKYGKSTQFSASEAADALGYMALAGWDAEKSASELGGVLNLAAASGMGLAEASDMVTDYLSAFSNSAMTATEFSDKLAYAQANSNTSAIQLGEAFKNSAANLNAAGQDVETVTSLLAAMANQGLKGSRAGTALSAVMRDITKSMDELNDEEALAKWGLEGMTDMLGKSVIQIGDAVVEVSDAAGNYRDLTEILKDVEAATASMGSAEKASALSSVFTADSIKGLNLILNEGIEKTADFEEQLRNCEGAAGDMSVVMNNNLSGDIKTMSSAFDEFKLTLYDSVNSPLRDTVKAISGEVLPALTNLVSGTEGAEEELGNAVGGLITNAIDNTVSNLPKFAKIGMQFITTLALGIVGAMPDAVNAAIQIVTMLLATLGEFVPDFVLEVVKAVPLIVSALLGAVPELIKGIFDLFTALVAAMPELIPELLKAIPIIINALVQALFDSYTAIFKGATELFNALVQALVDTLPELVEALPDLVKGLIKALVAFSPELLMAGVELFTALVEALPIIIEALLDALPDLIIAFITALVDSAPLILDASVQMFMALVEAVPIIVSALIKAFPQILTAIINGIKTIGQKLGTFTSESNQNFYRFLTGLIAVIKASIPSLVTAAGDVGRNVVAGIWNGIQASSDWLKNQIIGFASNILGGFKNALGIKSPSKAFRDEIGKWLLPGMVEGFKSEMPETLRDMKKAAVGIVHELEQSMPKLDLGISTGTVGGIQSLNGATGTGQKGTATGTATGTVNNVTFNQYNTSPKALDRLTIYRDTNSMLFAAKVRVGNV